MNIKDLATINAHNIIDTCEEIGFNQVVSAYVDGYNYAMKIENPWRNFKDERPKPGSHILRMMICTGYKVIYYADFWPKNRPDEWKQEDDRVVYKWQYINE